VVIADVKHVIAEENMVIADVNVIIVIAYNVTGMANKRANMTNT
jgi:hypothetical protein